MSSASDSPAALPACVDHLIYAVPDLQSGMREIADLLGVRPAFGGRHPNWGTHNALLSLGPTTYLEIIAPDPDAPAPARGRLLGMSEQQVPRLATWVMRSNTIRETVAGARAAGVGLGNVESGSRRAPDGTLLNWALSDPYAMPCDGAVPFLIDWGDTPHPGSSAPRAGELVALSIEHPECAAVRFALSSLDADIGVKAAEAFALTALIKTSRGVKTLK